MSFDYIKALLREDQENIKSFKRGEISLEKFQEKAERLSVKFFSIYKKYGFPYKDKNTEEDYRGAVTLTLHQTLENMEIIFEDIKNAPMGKIDQKDIAFITDKIKVLKGEKQIYGTQYKIKNGKIKLLPIEDVGQVDQRRTEIGLETLEGYIKSQGESSPLK